MTANIRPHLPGRKPGVGEPADRKRSFDVFGDTPDRGHMSVASAAGLQRFPLSSHARALLPIGVLALWGGILTLLFKGVRGWALACGASASVFGLFASLAMARGLVAVTVHGTSMEPAYRDGDRVIAHRGRHPKIGQVVVVERPTSGYEWPDPPVPPRAGETLMSRKRWMIKRIAAVPGDPVPRAQVPALTEAPEDRVPPGKLVLLGDNQDASFDSRHVGYFPVERVLGVVLRSLR